MVHTLEQLVKYKICTLLKYYLSVLAKILSFFAKYSSNFAKNENKNYKTQETFLYKLKSWKANNNHEKLQ